MESSSSSSSIPKHKNSDTTQKSVLLIGCTRGVGMLSARELLLNSNHMVVLMSRSKSKAEDIMKKMIQESKETSKRDLEKEYKERFEVVEADLSDKNTFEKVFANRTIDTVLCCAASTKGWVLSQNDKCTPKSVDYLGTKDMIEYSHSKGVQSFILLTAAKVTKPFSLVYILLNSAIGRVMHWKRQAELSLESTFKDRNYLMVRPFQLVDKDEGKYPTVVDTGDNKGGFLKISREDTAQFCVQAIGRYEDQIGKGAMEIWSDLNNPFDKEKNNPSHLSEKKWVINYDTCFKDVSKQE